LAWISAINAARVSPSLKGPKRISPQEIGTSFAKILGHAVRVEAVPRKTWQALFESQGMLHPLPRIQMLDGFNEGWIDFEGGQASTVKGKSEVETILQELVDLADENDFPTSS
jgi:NAD(P)H dehydrogenase (quinone)